ncbi:MAG: hypothetical protein EA360_03265 [Balneolaceae bacterium]|nr:MAG: hypothetical protein EA360_03265 [Balneolaceae bacterium]
MEESLRILKPYLRGLPLIAVSMIVGYLIMAQYLNYVTPKYESVTRLRLADIDEGVPNSNLYKDFDVFATANKLAAEVEVLKSQMLIDEALNHLDFDIEKFRVGKMRTTELYHDSPFTVQFLTADNSHYNRPFHLHLRDNLSYTLIEPGGKEFRASLGDTLDLSGTKLILSLNEPYVNSRNNTDIADHYQFKKLSRPQLISQIQSNLSILPVDRDVAVIRLIFASPHPQKAAVLPDMLAKTYIEDYISTKSGAASVTMDFLDEQVKEVMQKLSQIELEIEAYRNAEQITNIRQESETILREISQMKIQQTNLFMSLEAMNELYRYVQEGNEKFEELAPNFEAFTDLLSTELIKKIKELRAEKRDLLLIYTPQEPIISVVDEKLNDIYAYLTESISNTRRNLEIKYENLSRDIELTELQLINYPEKERLLTILEREFEIYQASYNFLNEKRIEAQIARAATISFHRIIDFARVPQSPFSPNYVILKIVAALLAGGGAIALIFLVHTIKARVNDKFTIQTNSSIAVVASTPNLKKKEQLQAHFLHLVNQLEIKNLIKPKSVAVFNAFGLGDGADFHALHTAEALSQQNHRVLLIDARNRMKLSPAGPGEIHHLTETLSVLHFLHPGYDFFTNNQIAELIKSVAESFDNTIINNDMIETQLSLQIMKASDTNFVVADSRLTPAKQIPGVDILKDEFSIENIFFILNRIQYNPNIVTEIANWLIKKAGLKKNKFEGLTYA